MMGTVRPYLAFTLDVIVSKSGPEVTSSTVPVTGVVPALTRPRTSLGCSVTLGSFRSRLALPEAEEVKTPTWPPSSGTIQVAVATATPVLRKGGHGHVLLLRDRLSGVAASHVLLLSK